MCHNCEEIFDYVIKLSESYRKDSEFQLVLKNFFFLLNNFFHFQIFCSTECIQTWANKFNVKVWQTAVTSKNFSVYNKNNDKRKETRKEKEKGKGNEKENGTENEDGIENKSIDILN